MSADLIAARELAELVAENVRLQERVAVVERERDEYLVAWGKRDKDALDFAAKWSNAVARVAALEAVAGAARAFDRARHDPNGVGLWRAVDEIRAALARVDDKETM